MLRMIFALAGFFLGGIAPVAVWAQSVVAIVEDVDTDRAGVSAMDYLSPGRVISLGGSGRIVVGYLRSCLREEVVGGTVTIGKESSVIANGRVRRSRVECDGGNLLLTPDQAGKSGVIVFRKGGVNAGGAPTPSLRIFSRQPVVRVASRAATLTIERLDIPETSVTVRLQQGVVDLAKHGKSLTRGGVYRATGGGKARVFRVDEYAVNGGSLISRLVAF